MFFPEIGTIPSDLSDLVDERLDELPARRCMVCSAVFSASEERDEEFHWDCRRCRETGAVRRPVKRSPKKKPRKPPNPKHGFPRYPGGKFKLHDDIMPILRVMAADLGAVFEYREPFLGGGATALAVLKERLTGSAWLNDCDPALAAYWNAVMNDVGGFNLLIEIFDEAAWRFPDVDYHRISKKILKKMSYASDFGDHSPDFIGFYKLICHRLSFSGLGTAGGRLPDLYSRFHCKNLQKHMREFHRFLAEFEIRGQRITSCDFEELLVAPGEALIYLDPPYFEKGPGLYQFAFAEQDHLRLARLLRSETRTWLLSYDNHSVIRDLYAGWTRIEQIGMTSSVNGSTQKTELLISNR